eukprot:TRINITY_DN1798_c0_g1_i1.p1 TRINITY_DN1798_c0_g1~~TRINITY_DN1798_c0_g1_i1.p1  ORF type:complete len:129 (-),score=22.90 TRINITY_DN1798_c0_g1_i1:55-405(-)
MTDIINFNTVDHFAVEDDQVEGGFSTQHSGYVHIRVQQRNARKKLTTCEGLDQRINFRRVLRALRKNFACNGNIVDHIELGKVIQLQGDKRNDVEEFLTRSGLCTNEEIKIHGVQD